MPPVAATTSKRATQEKKPRTRLWLYEAKTKTGEIKKGEMEALDAEAVNARLRSLGFQPVKVKKKPLEINLRLPGSTGVATKDLVVFTRTFATMIDAGLPLVQCLDLLAGQSDNPALKKTLLTVKAKVESGATFADALREHPKIFNELFVQLVAAGEMGGILDTILNRLAAYIEKNAKLARRVKGAMTYPIVVIIVAVVVTIALLIKVIPTFEKMFRDFGGAMPAPTQFVIDLSRWMQHYIVHLVVGVAAAVVAVKVFLSTKKGRALFDKAVLKAPVIGPVVRKIAVARFTRTLGTMISSGVPLLEALDVVAKTAGNKTVEAAVYYTRTKISEGKTIASPLMETGVFPPMVVQMVGVGEATGAMDQMLNKVADFYDDEVDVAISGLTSMIEPVLMMFLSAVVGGFIIAMYLPIFSIAGQIQ